MARYPVCKADEIEVGRLMRAAAGRASILLARLPSGEIRAFAARCPHQGADLGFGCVSGMTSSDTPNELCYHNDGEIVRCPWHGFEFSMKTGEALAASRNRNPLRLRLYKVELEGDQVVVVVA
ncbi:MAG: Rieske (2Fe-2S) protein [Rhodomicrobium sp.]|nr:Rieske (2Fe-2S) protein [Rhodomicrobium sp.]